MKKIMTIVMTALSLAFFALASMGYTYDEQDYLTKSYRRFLKRNCYLVFDKNQGEGLGNEFSDYIQEETAVDFLSAVYSDFIFLQSYFYEALNPLNSQFVNDYIQPFTNSPIVSSTEELMDEMGFRILAGRRPEGAQELMVSKDVFTAFYKGGYAKREGENVLKEEIKTQADLLGKQLFSSIEQREVPFTIVGIFDNEAAKERDKNWEYTYPKNNLGNAKIVFSKAFEEKWIQEGAVEVNYLFAPVKDELLTDKKIQSYIKVSEELLRRCEGTLKQNLTPEQEKSFDLYAYRSYIGAIGYSFSLGHYTKTSLGGMWLVDYYVLILSAVGGVLLMMAVVFNTYLMTDFIYKKRRQVGILRSLGYSKSKISRLFLCFSLLLAAMTFLVALVFTLSIYYGWFRAFVTSGDGVLFEFSFWTVLILLFLSALIPTLSSVVPLLLFFKKPIVDNIKARE